MSTKSGKSDHLSRVAEVEDIERIEKSWTKCAQRDGLTIPKKAINELHKRIKQASSKDPKAKLDFVKCGLDDGLVMTLMEALATAPVISKIDLKGNKITNKSANFILRLLRGQVTLIRTVPIDDRLSAAFLGEFILDDKDVSEDIFNEIQSISDILRQANAIAHVRKAYIDFGAPTVMNAVTVSELWSIIVGKPEKGAIDKAMNTRSSNEFVLNYEELELVLLDALVQKGICPKIPDWAGEKIGLKPAPAPTPAPIVSAPVPAPTPAPIVSAPSPTPSPVTVVEKRGVPEDKRDSPNVTNNSRDSPKQAFVEKYDTVDDVIDRTQADNEVKIKNVSVSSPSQGTSDHRKSVRYVDTQADQDYYNSTSITSPISAASSSSSKKPSPSRHSFYGFGEKRMSSATIESPSSIGSKSPKTKSPKTDADDNDAQEFIDQVLASSCLDLGNQGITDLNVAEIFPESQLPAIKILILRQNTVSRPEYMGLIELSQLTDLDLSMNSIEGKFPENCLPHSLINLDLSHNLISDIAGVLCCINLKTLNVSHNRLKKINGLPPLIEKVNLSDNLLASPVTLRVISACPKIWAVGIAGNPLLNKIADWRAQLVSLCPKVIEIDGVLRPGYKLKVKEPKKELPPTPKNTKKISKKEQVERDRARIIYHNEQKKLMDDMRVEFHSNIIAPPRYLDKESIETLTNRLSEPLKPRGQNKRGPVIKKMPVKQAEIIVQNWLSASSLEIGRAVAALNMVVNMRDTFGLIDADQLMYFSRALEKVSFAKDFVLTDEVDLAMSTLPDDNDHIEIIQSTAEMLENMASFSAVLQSLEEVLNTPNLSGEDLAPALDAIMLSEYGVHINESVLSIYGTRYEPTPEVPEKVVQAAKPDVYLEEMKLRIEARALQGSKVDAQSDEIEDDVVIDNSTVELNDFKLNSPVVVEETVNTAASVEETVVESVKEKAVDSVVAVNPSVENSSAAIGQSASADDNLSTKERLKARIEEKRKLKELEATQ